VHTDPDLWILTCAPGHRADEAAQLFDNLGMTPGVLVTTQPDPVPFNFQPEVEVLLFDSEEINISKWWTLGLDHIASQYADDPDAKWDVLLVETDTYITLEHADRMRRLMREQECVMAGADFYHVMPDMPFKVRRDNSVWRHEGRCIGLAQMLVGEAGLRHDPEFRWWLADDDFEWQARVNGGTILVGGLDVTHKGTQGPLTGERLIAWEEDQIKFKEKWGALPADGGIPA
jgi:RNAse (barnase) inhibitor barstar